jgi:lipopolysaccharide export system permease protein
MGIPIGFLLAVLLALGRMSEDRELVAMAAAGMGPLQLIRVPVVMGAVLSGLILLFAFTSEPRGLSALKATINEIIKRNVVGDVKSGVFYEDLTNLTLYAERVDRRRQQWTNVLVHDDRDPGSPLLVLARVGGVNPAGAGEALKLTLSDGDVHRSRRESDEYTIFSFERGDIAVGLHESTSKMSRFRSPREELTPSELLLAARDARAEGQNPTPYLMALHGRLGHALAPLAFALFGTGLSLLRRQEGRTRGFALTLGGYLGYYLASRFFENLALQGKLPVLVAGQITNVAFLGWGLWALWRASRSGTAA